MYTDTLKEAVAAYRRQYGCDPEVAAFGPGRVNLIGEHTDYQGGFVLPFALPFHTVVVGSKSAGGDKCCRVSSSSMNGAAGGQIPFTIDETKSDVEWVNYFKGTVYQYKSELPNNAQFRACIASNVPLGSGLSSSAAIETATATFLEALYNITTVTPTEKALRCQKAEHDFAGMPCGIMDQFISVQGAAGHLLQIDCKSQKGTLVSFASDSSGPVVVVTNSNVKHALTDSEYPQRVAQCKAAVTGLQKKYPDVKMLRDAGMVKLESVKGEMSEVEYRRARHVITENDRVLEVVHYLRQKNVRTVGLIMSASHESLSKDYEVSCKELDLLQSLAHDVPGVYGSRMTGGGFGGCTVTLLERSAVADFKKYVGNEYKQQTGTDCTFYEATPSAGAGTLEKELAAVVASRKQRENMMMTVGVTAAMAIVAAAMGVYFRRRAMS
jgi:galactokinase